MNSKRTPIEYIKDALSLMFVFFKLGLFTFGGGYAMLSLIEDEVVEKKNWLTHAELSNIFAIAESTPGPIAINVATFIGVKRLGILGGILTTISVALPSFAVIIAVSYLIDILKDNYWVQAIFKGVRVGVIVLILRAVITFYKSIKKNWFSLLLLIASFVLVFIVDISVVYIILGSIIITSIAVGFVNYRNNHKYHMLNTPEYYSEATGKTIEKDEYYSEKAVEENLIKVNKEVKK